MAYPLDDLPVARPCPHCSASNYIWRVECSSCHQRMQPALISSGPIVLAALADSVDDLPPGGKAYTLKIGRHTGVADREPNYDYLARWAADMYRGEWDYGLAVDTLACQYGTMYSKGRLQAGLRR